MSEYLDRELTSDEVVDHIDENKLNDCIENYQLLSLEENARKSMKRFPAKWYEFVCPSCGNNS